jgi:adenosylmethionine-8-amino-7-oxononanoate aminotransferase
MSGKTGALWHAQAHMPTVAESRIVMVKGEGAYLEDENGKRYLDVPAGLWFANIGHGRTEVGDAVSRQIAELETHHVFGPFANRPAIELAERVAAMGPIEDAKVIWTSGGSDAVDNAGKLVRRHWQLQGRTDKRIILSRENSYHGLHAFGTSLAGLPFNREGYGSESLVPETALVATNDLESVTETIDRLGSERIAAYFAEPIVGTGGVIPPDPGYFEGIRELCRERDIIFVADEVITGFGRTGSAFASQQFDLDPDIVLFAKGVTSGYLPLGGILVSPKLWEPFFDGPDAPIYRHGITYSGHAAACVAAGVNLDIIESEGLIERVASLETVVRDSIGPLEDLDGVAEVRVAPGLMCGVEMESPAIAAQVAASCIERGYVMRVLKNTTLQIAPPFVVEPEAIQDLANTIGECVLETNTAVSG